MSKIIDEKYMLFALLMWAGSKLRVKTKNFFHGITVNQWLLLSTIRNFEGSPTLSEIANIMGNSHQNIKELINKLEKKGFLLVSTDLHDKRKYNIAVTDKFHEISRQYEGLQTLFINQMYEGISDEEIKDCFHTAEKILKNLE
jgi:DNA-binding MarR family transcriptional regulator